MAEVTTPDDMWTPFKNLYSVLESHLTNQVSEANIGTLELLLRKHKQNFTTLLKNAPKNAKFREEIRRGITDGVTLPGLGRTVLSKDLVDESIIISDMYDLNEYIALELLCTAQQQMPHHPGLPRGLVAVLLYYDGRKALVATLKELFQARMGISWCTDTSPEVTHLVTDYTNTLVSDGILIKIMELLESLDLSKELEMLTANRALGPQKHYRQVLDLFEEIRLILATCLFSWSAQCGLPKNVTLKLIDYFSKYKPSDPRGGIDDVTLTILMALLYAYDLSVLQRREDGEEMVKNLPIIKEAGYVQAVLDALMFNWEFEGFRSIALFAFGLSMTTLRLAPQNLQTNATNAIDQDESCVDAAIDGKVFDFIHHIVLENPYFFKMEFFFRRLHSLLTDFIELMHSKVTELRARADETARTVQCYAQEGIDPPSGICHSFEILLLTVGKLYGSDKLGLCLCLEYWGPMEIASNYQRASSRSVSLFKFIRLAGELLPPILFVPYLKMLAGLSNCQQSARNAFNLLKQGSYVSGSTTITWDHFFSSLQRYYSNLRQEQHPSTETVYRNRALSRNISPQEIAGLQAVLGVIRAVATHDEVARIALCEHPTWAPIQILLGLISCSVIIPLKADLLLTLSAMSKSKETAIQLWNSLESSQVITTVPSTNQFNTQGIKSEIEQNECRNEIYPLTQAILDLLYNLSSTAIPKNLGAGPRIPGLDPYLTFIIDTVFLRFYNRNYKDPTEQWIIAEKCLQLLDMFLKKYEVHPTDFTANDQFRDQNAPPGFHIMLQMNTKSDTLRLILEIIDMGCSRLDTYTNFPGKKELENSCLYCLNIIEHCLSIQELFFHTHSAANCSILLSGLNKLLLGVNPRSGKPDHMLNITKFVTYKSWLPTHCLMAVKILTFVSRHPNVNSQLLGMFTSTEQIKITIRHGFVESLEGELDTYDGEIEEGSIELQIKESILNLLQESLPHPAPNLAHYLLGFDISKDIRNARLQQAGVIDFPSTCAKSLVTILDRNLDKMKSERIINVEQEKLIERAYGLLYSLCQNSKTSEIVLRFLRSCNDFLCRHLSALPFKNFESPKVLNQMTGLLKSVAIELKITAAKSQITQFGHLCKILLGVNQEGPQENLSIELNHYYSLAQGTINTSMANKNLSDSGHRLLIGQLLECLDFEMKSVDRPKWDVFDNSLMTNLLQSCEINTGASSGLKLIDIKKLNNILRDELNTVQSTMAAGQRQLILQEIESVLVYALQINSQKNISASTAKFMEALGQVTEILFSVSACDGITAEFKQTLILEILQIILKKVVSTQIMTELANLASSTVLLLMVNLRHCYQIAAGSDQQRDNIAVSNLTLNDSRSSFSPKSNTLSLKYILKNIVEWIIVSGVASQKLRINLYAALLNFMHIMKTNGNKQDTAAKDEFYVSRLDKTMAQFDGTAAGHYSDQTQMAIEVFTAFGDKLIDILCHDCTGGHDVCRMLALSCIDMLLDMDSMISFIQFISKRGYLAHIIDSLLKSDNQLCRVLENIPENLKALYVYESKMAMLSRVSSSYFGAELLLQHRVLGVLSGMKAYDLHPDFQVNNYMMEHRNQSSFIPPVEIRYQQILFPALNLCDVILSTLGSENHSAVTQVVHFLLSHGDMIEIVLRAGTPFLGLGLLQELSALTGLIARTANQTLSTLAEPNANQDLGAHLYRLQKLMLTLFPRFILSETTLKEIKKAEILNCPLSKKDDTEYMKYFLQIAANVALYARNAIANHSADHRSTGVLFSPNIGDGIQKFDGRGSTLEVSPNLGIVISQLKCIVEYHNREKIAYDNLLRQKNLKPSLNLDANAQTQYANLSEKLTSKQNELKLCVFIAEHCLYLLWAHLDFFMLRAIPVDTLQFRNTFSSFGDGLINTSMEAGWKVTSEDISGLKKNLISVFNETFCNQLVSTQDPNSSDKFIEALLRRIKRFLTFVPVK